MSFKHLSFIDLFTIESLIVEIPMLQRDYAYGRISEREKRAEFLGSIKGYLQSENTNHELDFIYGSVNTSNGERILILLDGQQRITTLFLLHWYFAVANQKFPEFRTLLLNGDKSKFTYNTRESSTEFCHALVSLCKKVKNKKGEEAIKKQEEEYYEFVKSLSAKNKISEKIKNEKWFFSHWNNDPTVINMLNMLDDIALNFPLIECEGFYDKLNKSGAAASITFNLLPLDEFKLTDELYIKMNSRGKPLTRFENLKSKMLKKYDEQKQSAHYQKKLKEINEQENKDYVSLRDYVGLMIDTRWTDMFWNFWLQSNLSSNAKPPIDDMFLSFISNICIFYKDLYVLNGSLSMRRNSTEEEVIENLMDAHNTISYENIIAMLQENNNYLLYNIIDILNRLSEKNDEGKWVLKNYFDNTVYFFDETAAFKKIVEDYTAKDRNYEDKAMYFGYISYLLQFKPEKNDINFIDWMRFVYDMCKNSYTLSNAVYTFSNCLAGINYLCSQKIYESLPTKQTSEIVTLDPYQLEEEILKAKLFENKKWRDAITDALSKLRYFEGQIHYELVDVNGITEEDKNNESKITAFTGYVNKVASVFNKTDGSTFDTDLVCALLSKGDYTTTHKSSYSLFQNGTSRDISWLRYHKTEKIGDNAIDKRVYLTQVLNDSDFDATKPQESLKKIAAKYPVSISEWRKVLIQYLAKFETSVVELDNYKFGTMRLLRWNDANKRHSKSSDDSYEIDLISRQHITSKHSELFTYAIFLDHTAEEILPFGKPSYVLQQSEDSEPFMVYGALEFLNEHYYLQLYYKDLKQFELRFVNWNDDEEICDNITNANILNELESNAFFKVEQQNYYAKIISHDEVMPKIREFCHSLNTIIN